ncbi:MAG: sulfatase-like hydrolase/transferase [Verrucomicrobia bacterium]|nr:sulfatase-like hydrolase/transferase [Verrucomicrobiota bacterium]MCH8511189.1 sulfatase-like hydrolase/transferase [Kiritimatiellia bacterium]
MPLPRKEPHEYPLRHDRPAQRACTGYENHPQVLTPHLDRFSANATGFRHAYTANPICPPTWASLLSGQYCHNHGYYGLSGPRPAGLPHFLGHFRDHGYRSALIGKGQLPNDPEDWLEGAASPSATATCSPPITAGPSSPVTTSTAP